MRIVEHRTRDAQERPELDGRPEIQQLPLPAFNPNFIFQQHALHQFMPTAGSSDQAQQWRWELPGPAVEVAVLSHARNDSKVDEYLDLPGPRISNVDLVPPANLFATRLSVLWPVLPDSIQREPVCINAMRLTRGIYSFLCAVAAFTMAILRSQYNFFAGRWQADSSLHAHCSAKEIERLDNGGVADRVSIRTALLLSLCYWEWEKPRLAWMCLHEAISLMQVSGFDKESAYAELSNPDAQEWKRLYWTLFVAERIQARRRGEPFRLQKSVSSPEATGQFAYLEGFCIAANTISLLRRSTTRLSAGPLEMGWLREGVRVVNQARQQLPLLPFIQRTMVWLSCVAVELQLWQGVAASPALASIKLDGRLNQDVPMLLLREICQTICSGDPLTFEVFGANLYLETIEVAICVVGQLASDPADEQCSKLCSLQQFHAWLERAENKPQAAFQRFQDKLKLLHPGIAPPMSTSSDARCSPMGASQGVPHGDAVWQVWSDEIAVQHDELVAPIVLPQEVPADCMMSPQACRPQGAEQGSPTMP